MVNSGNTLQPRGRIISRMLIYNMVYTLFQCWFCVMYGVACKIGVRVEYHIFTG